MIYFYTILLQPHAFATPIQVTLLFTPPHYKPPLQTPPSTLTSGDTLPPSQHTTLFFGHPSHVRLHSPSITTPSLYLLPQLYQPPITQPSLQYLAPQHHTTPLHNSMQAPLYNSMHTSHRSTPRLYAQKPLCCSI